MPDPIFSHPRLAEVYDAFDGPRDDLTLYLGLATRLNARSVVDIGCGTGVLARQLAANGHSVIAVDPAAASIDLARAHGGAADVSWLLGTAADLPEIDADLAVMTGNVVQALLSDEEWAETLLSVRRVLRPGGHLAFETRRPESKVWEQWALEDGQPTLRAVPGVGEVEQRFELTGVDLPLVSFRFSYRFLRDGSEVASHSTLRFRSYEEVVASLAEHGFVIVDVLDAPDRPGLEYVFLAANGPE